MSRGPVFRVPAAPPEIGGAGGEAIRIVDPTGAAVAWIAPGRRAGCVGFAVRRDRAPDGWSHVFPAAGGPAPAARRGCAPVAALSDPQSGPRPGDFSGVGRRVEWRFAERDPTAVVLAAGLAPESAAATRRSDGAGLRLRFTARLDEATLLLGVEAANDGEEPVVLRLGLRFDLALATVPVAPAADAVGAGADIRPGTVVARGCARDGFRFGIVAMGGVRGVASVPGPGHDPALGAVLVLGRRAWGDPAILRGGASTAVAAGIGPIGGA